VPNDVSASECAISESCGQIPYTWASSAALPTLEENDWTLRGKIRPSRDRRRNYGLWRRSRRRDAGPQSRAVRAGRFCERHFGPVVQTDPRRHQIPRAGSAPPRSRVHSREADTASHRASSREAARLHLADLPWCAGGESEAERGAPGIPAHGGWSVAPALHTQRARNGRARAVPQERGIDRWRRVLRRVH